MTGTPGTGDLPPRPQPPETTTKPFTEKTPQELRRDFRDMWKGDFRGNFPMPKEGQQLQEATEEVTSYEVVFDPMNATERRHSTSEFSLRAIAAGFDIAATIPASNVGYRDTKGERPLSSITYLLKGPIDPVESPPGPAGTIYRKYL